MNKLVFATNNQNKVEEIKSVIGDLFKVVSLKEAGIDIDIPELYSTLEENAREKSRTIYRLTGENCFSEDTGLETEALNGEPGVKSARYAGEGKNPDSNTAKLLLALKGNKNRKARFHTVISLIINDMEQQFSGVCEGFISYEPKGDKGFGYDSIFIPNGDVRTFGEMSIEEKNFFSHRRKAVRSLLAFLSQNGNKMYQ